MANQPFDYETINFGERPLSSDVNMVMSYAQLAVRELMLEMFSSRGFGSSARSIFPGANAAAFLGASFTARALGSPAMAVTLDPGLGVYNNNLAEAGLFSISGVNDESVFKPLVLTPSAAEVTTGITGIPNGDATNPRVDLIEVKLNRVQRDSTSRDVLNPSTGVFSPNAVFKTMSYALDGTATVNGSGAINYKTGAPGASNIYPTGAPGTDSGYVPIAYVNVPANATSILGSYIVDYRELMLRGGILDASAKLNVQAGPTLLQGNLVAPPGVLSTFYPDVGGGGFWDWIILAGRANFSALDTVMCQEGFSPQTGGIGFDYKTNDPQVITVTSAIQTALAAATPGLIVAVGQPVIRTAFTIGLASPPAIFHATLRAQY